MNSGKATNKHFLILGLIQFYCCFARKLLLIRSKECENSKGRQNHLISENTNPCLYLDKYILKHLTTLQNICIQLR